MAESVNINKTDLAGNTRRARIGEIEATVLKQVAQVKFRAAQFLSCYIV